MIIIGMIFIYNYNHTVNRGIGIEPYKITESIEHEILIRHREKTVKIYRY